MDESTLSRMASDPGEMSCDEGGIFADNEEDAEAYYAYMSASHKGLNHLSEDPPLVSKEKKCLWECKGQS